MVHILACPNCGGANGASQLLCRFCGRSLTHKCARCQVDIDPASGKCPYCGEALPAWQKENIRQAKTTSRT